MEILPDCLPCMMRQALTAARKAGADKKAASEITRRAAGILSRSEHALCAPELCRMIHEEVKRSTSCTDPYYEDKVTEIALAKSQLGKLEAYINASDDPLKAALKAAAAGNIIDAAVDGELVPEKLQGELEKPFELCCMEKFREALEKTDEILYIGDNSGEAVFDTVLLERLRPKKIIYAVRGAAVLNDVDMHTASLAGVDKYAEVMSSGCASPGCIYSECTEEFQRLFDSAGLIIAKGQGNYEGLSECGRQVFFLLKAKCPVLAAHLDVPRQSYVLTV